MIDCVLTVTDCVLTAVQSSELEWGHQAPSRKTLTESLMMSSLSEKGLQTTRFQCLKDSVLVVNVGCR